MFELNLTSHMENYLGLFSLSASAFTQVMATDAEIAETIGYFIPILF